MHQHMKWEEYLPLVEFSYNNGYQESLKTSPFEALYRWSCNTPIRWSNLVNKLLIGLDMLAEMKQEMQVIKRNLKETHDSQKSYADQHKAFKEFQFRKHVYLRIKPKRSSLRIRSCAKLTLGYCQPFEILERIDPVAYRISLSP